MSGKQATDHLLLRNLRDEADKRRFASFNATCNNAFEGATCDCLLHHHPETTQEDYWLIEDLTTGEVVSTVCLIPWPPPAVFVTVGILLLMIGVPRA